METRVTRYLESVGVRYVLKPHSKAVYTARDAARERGIRLSQVIKAMLLKDGEGFLMVLVPGDREIDWRKLKMRLGTSAAMATREELENFTGFPLGAVSPLSLPEPCRVLLDDAITRERYVDISSGDLLLGVELLLEDLVRLVSGEVGSFSLPARNP
jgi:prolyl-tRNA editing enzyme YbaK/EbsC (Cys-tRNA(Pro) deacylase)